MAAQYYESILHLLFVRVIFDQDRDVAPGLAVAVPRQWCEFVALAATISQLPHDVVNIGFKYVGQLQFNNITFLNIANKQKENSTIDPPIDTR